MANSVNVKMKVDTKKLKADYAKKNDRAMRLIKSQILKDTEPFTPMRDRTLINSATKSVADSSNKIIYSTPYARFLWHGKVMIGVKSHSPWAKKNETKMVTNRNLTYSHGGKEWFLNSKKKNLDKWIKVAKSAFKRG